MRLSKPFSYNLLSLTSGLLALLIFAPVLALIYESLFASASLNDDTFSNLAQSVLWDYLANSLQVVAATLVFACLFAIAPAWWCARYEFKGRNILQWAMVFPLAIPAYISGYIYTEALDYAGPIQTSLREFFGWQSPRDYWFFDIRSITGASLMLALALYPYIYLLMRNAFANQSDHLEHAARLLGASQRRLFFRVHLPLARPALAIGCTLVAMESLADFGTVHLFAISTLTTAIYDSWLVYGSLSTAAKISCLLLLFVVSLVWLESRQRKAQKHYDLKGSHGLSKKIPSRTQLLLIWGVCLSIITLGFIIPLLTLVGYNLDYFSENWHSTLWQHSQHTFMLAFGAALICTVLALLFNSNHRFVPNRLNLAQKSISSIGYAIPGTVLAIALLIPLGRMDLTINGWLEYWQFDAVGLIFSGTSFALLVAFVIRFTAIANGSVHAAYQQIPPNLDLAARSLNSNRWRLFKNVHLPLITPATISALLLVFIECVKELPAAILLRPFDFETLSTYVYQFASDEQLEHGAAAALLIIVVSLLPILVLSRTQRMS
ncbi:MAG: iron ABC transporter permease [Bermanella sp.]